MGNKDLKESFINALAKIVAYVAKPFYCCYKKHVVGDKHVKNDENIFRFGHTIVAVFALVVVSGLIFYACPCSSDLDEAISDSIIEEASVIELTDEDVKIHNKILSSIKDFSTVYISGYEIVANDNQVAFVQSKDIAEDILESLKDRYRIDLNNSNKNDEEHEEVEIVRCYFEQDVDIEKTFVPIVKALPMKEPQEQLERIIKGNIEQRRHVVEKGENFWDIAQGYGIPVDTLIAANSELDPKTLQIGQTISLVLPRPLISVYTVHKSEYDDPIPYDIVYEDTASMFQGEYRVKVKGQKGSMHVEAEIYRMDGLEAGRIILSESVLLEPSTKVVYRGTKPPPPRKGTGVFSRPINGGVVTSGFGWRWGRMHKGIDIGVPIGTPVKAADGGVVVFAGTKGGYGKCVIIDHGANMKTLYAHNSKLHVRKGDKVYKGQVICGSGNTGRSTGPHLHFEIRKNNEPVNPTKYLSF